MGVVSSINFYPNLFRRDKINLALAILIPGILFLTIPIFGCLFSIILTFLVNEKNYVKITFTYLYTYIILIQGQRIPIVFESGDWNGYIELYNDTLHSTFFSTERGSKDICYTLWNFLLHPLFGKNGNAFLNFTVDISFLFWGLSTLRLWRYSGKDARTGLCAIILIFLFSEILFITNNLVRQQFASSIMIWSVILRFTKSKYWWCFMIWGLLTHSMTAIFLPLFFISINKKLSKKIILLTVLGSIFITGVFIVGKNLFLASSFYVLHHIGSSNEYLGSDVIEPKVIYIFTFIVLIIYFKHYCFDKNINQYIWMGLNFLAYITLLCIITAFMPLVVTRIYIERLPLLSFVLPYFFTKPSQYNTIYQLLIILFFSFRYMFISHSEYIDISYYAVMPLGYLIFNH